MRDRGERRFVRPFIRNCCVAAAAIVAIAPAAMGQISATWTGLGDTPSFDDPYNWSSFPNVPGGGGEVVHNGPYKSVLDVSVDHGIAINRWSNIGSLGARLGGSGSITLVGDAEISSALGPVGTPTAFRWTDIIFTPIFGSSGLTKRGSGVMELFATSGFTGGTRIYDGWIVPVTDASLGTTGEAVLLDGGGIYVGTNLASRPMSIGAGGGTFFCSGGTLGSVAGTGTLAFDADSQFTFQSSSLVATASHSGPTQISSIRLVLRPSANGTTHGRMSSTQSIEVSGGLVIGDGTTPPPSDCLNNGATLAVRGGSINFRTNVGTPEEVQTFRLTGGRTITTGSFAFERLERTTGAAWRLDGTAEPIVHVPPNLVGSGPAGTPTVGVLPFAAAIDTALAIPVTVQAGHVRRFISAEQLTPAQLSSPNSPDVNVKTTGSLSQPITVRSVQVIGGSSGAAISVSGGGVYIPQLTEISNPLNFGNSEGFIHSPSLNAATISGAISGTAGLTIAGNIVLSGQSTYTGPTFASGSLEIRGPVISGLPSPIGMDSSPLVIQADSANQGILVLRNVSPVQPYRWERPIKFVSEGRRAATLGVLGTGVILPATIAGDLEINGVLNIANVNFAGPTINISGQIKGPGTLKITATGSSVVTLAGDNSFSGGTELVSAVRLGTDTALGTGPLWIQTVGSAAVIEAVNGERTINNPVQLIPNPAGLRFVGNDALNFTSRVDSLGPATVDLAAAAPLTFGGGVLNHALSVIGTGTLQVAYYRGRGLEARSGRITLLPDLTATSSRAGTFAIAAGAVVDLNDHTLVIERGGGTVTGGEAGVRTMLADHRLISTVATNNPGAAIGYARAGDILNVGPGLPPATFAGQLVREEELLVMYTLAGDTDLDRDVDMSDFSRLASNFNLAGVWSRGDFDYNGTIAIGDFALLAGNFNRVLATSPARSGVVPEPSKGFVAMAAALKCHRRRRSG